jgi:hypothetical protein
MLQQYSPRTSTCPATLSLLIVKADSRFDLNRCDTTKAVSPSVHYESSGPRSVAKAWLVHGNRELLSL